MTFELPDIIDAAQALPRSLRSELAAKLVESLSGELCPAFELTPEQLADVLNRSDELHRDHLIDGEIILERLQAIIDRNAASS